MEQRANNPVEDLTLNRSLWAGVPLRLVCAHPDMSLPDTGLDHPQIENVSSPTFQCHAEGESTIGLSFQIRMIISFPGHDVEVHEHLVVQRSQMCGLDFLALWTK